jgi:ribosomal-protein-alanine N-acetyltransferase
MPLHGFPPILETERLILRPGVAGDAATFHRMWTERDPRVPPHRRIGADGRPTVEDVAERIRAEDEAAGPGLLTIERRDTREVIGYCGLVARGHGSADEPELAFELLRVAHGYGYATEAGRAVVAWADEAGYRRLWAGVREWNAASRGVLAKLGFRESGEVEPDPVHGDSLLTVRESR